MPATRSKIAQGEESRKKLLEAAAQIMGQGGYSSASVDAIARQANVGKSALYWHFGSKNGLLLACLADQSSRWVADFQAHVSKGASPTERLDTLINRARRLIVEHPDHRRMIFSLLLERGHEDPEIRGMVAKLFEERRDALVDGFLASTGLPKKRLVPLCEMLIHMGDGMLLRYLSDPDEARLDSSLHEMRAYVMLRIESIMLSLHKGSTP
ncbi:MAG: hypothetical protein CMH55_08130 [Myxococcales bacterium]|nr:hypothetical protein [Myxococcales bacterium]